MSPYAPGQNAIITRSEVKKKIKKNKILQANALLSDLELLHVFLNILVRSTGRGETSHCPCLARHLLCVPSAPSTEHGAALRLQQSQQAPAAANSELSKDSA